MALLARLYPLMKPWLFRMDAEDAHEVTTRLMRMAHRLGMIQSAAPKNAKPVRVCGLKFPNLLGLAAGMDKSASSVEAWGALGFGFVEVGTLTPRPQPGNDRPRLFRLPGHRALINRMGFNNPGIHAAVEKLAARKFKGVVGVNIGKNFDTPLDSAAEDYVACLKAAYPVADYIAVNISSPNTKGLRDLQAEQPIRLLLDALRKEQAALRAHHGRVVPVLVKIAPDLEEPQIESLARVFTEMEIEGVVATNTTIARTGVADDPRSTEQGGLSGAPLTRRATDVIRAFRELLPESMPIIGVGGIMSGADAVDKLRAGASLLQIYSGLVYAGPALITDILSSTAE